MAKVNVTQAEERGVVPRGGLLSLHDAMDRFFFGNGFDIPRVDVSEGDKEIRIEAELPGMDEKNVEITLSKDRVTIQGEKKEEKEEKGRDFYRKERSFGSIYREIPLPCEVMGDKTSAEFKNGVLNIILPKSEAAKKETIKIPVKGH